MEQKKTSGALTGIFMKSRHKTHGTNFVTPAGIAPLVKTHQHWTKITWRGQQLEMRDTSQETAGKQIVCV